eukprot:jgi/Ulvmu1/4185/UM019_0164.1
MEEAFLTPGEPDRPNEVSFMDAMAVYMGMDIPKNLGPTSEAEAALAFLESLWLFCQNDETTEHVEQNCSPDNGSYMDAAKRLHDMAFVSATLPCDQVKQDLSFAMCETTFPNGLSLSQAGSHNEIDTLPAAETEFEVTHHDPRIECVVEAVIERIALNLNKDLEENLQEGKPQPLLNQLVNSGLSSANGHVIQTLRAFTMKEKRIAAGLVATWNGTEKHAARMLAVHADSILQELKHAQRNFQFALNKLSNAAQCVQGTLQAWHWSIESSTNQAAVHSLKAALKSLFKCLKDNVSLYHTKASVKKKADAALARILLLKGKNPYEAQRQVRNAQQHNRLARRMKQAVEAGRAHVLQQLLCEHHTWSAALQASADMQECELAFQREMGGLAMVEKVESYMLKHTKHHVDMLDPTGRSHVFPSQAAHITHTQCGAPKCFPESSQTLQVEADRQLLDIAMSKHSLSAHEFDGSWGTNAKRPYTHLLGTKDQVRNCGSDPSQTNGHFSASPVASTQFVVHPAQAIFRDFEPGLTYSLQVTLTNRSSQRSACRVLETSASVAGILEINMDPPGFLSAGMSCHMRLLFKPQVDEDMSTTVQIATDLGKLTMPVKCLRRRAAISLSASLIDFGACVVGDKRVRTFELQNSGALQVKYVVAAYQQSIPGELEPVQTTAYTYRGAPATGPEFKPAFCFGPFTITPQQGVCTGYTTVLFHAAFEPSEVKKLEVVLELTCTALGKDVREDHTVSIHLQGTALDLPIKTNADILDFRTCMAGKKYRGQFVLYNSSQMPRKAVISGPLCTARWMSLNPGCALVQGHGKVSVSVDFTPTAAMLQQCSKYLLPGRRSIELPISITVPDQPIPLQIAVKATLSSPDLQIEPQVHNLGVCNVNERVTSAFVITNTTLVEQSYAIVCLPGDVIIRECTGVIPPNTRKQLGVIYTPQVAGLCNFHVKVKTLCLQARTLSFQADVVRPQLSLSHNFVELKATSFSGTTTASVLLQNFGTISQKFAFDARNSSVRITPASGSLAGGSSVRVQVDHSPKGAGALQCLEQSVTTSETVQDGQQPWVVLSGQERVRNPQTPSHPISHVIGCYSCVLGRSPVHAACTSLEVRTCEVTSGLVLAGASVDWKSGRFICDFGVIPSGSSRSKTLTLLNMRSNAMQLKCKPLNPFGPFEQVTACPTARGAAATPLRIQFAPKTGGAYMELLQIEAGALSLICELHGAAEHPTWNVSQDVPVDMMTRITGGSHALIQIENPCGFPSSCSLESRPRGFFNTGNCPSLIVQPCWISASPRDVADVQLSYRPDWQGPHFEQFINISSCGPDDGKDVALKDSVFIGCMRICGPHLSCIGVRLPPSLPPAGRRPGRVFTALMKFPTVKHGEEGSIDLLVQNLRPTSLTSEVQVTFQNLTVQERLLGWKVHPMQLALRSGDTQAINVTLALSDHGLEASAAALGLNDEFILTLNGKSVDTCAPGNLLANIALIFSASTVP